MCLYIEDKSALHIKSKLENIFADNMNFMIIQNNRNIFSLMWEQLVKQKTKYMVLINFKHQYYLTQQDECLLLNWAKPSLENKLYITGVTDISAIIAEMIENGSVLLEYSYQDKQESFIKQIKIELHSTLYSKLGVNLMEKMAISTWTSDAWNLLTKRLEIKLPSIAFLFSFFFLLNFYIYLQSVLLYFILDMEITVKIKEILDIIWATTANAVDRLSQIFEDIWRSLENCLYRIIHVIDANSTTMLKSEPTIGEASEASEAIDVKQDTPPTNNNLLWMVAGAAVIIIGLAYWYAHGSDFGPSSGSYTSFDKTQLESLRFKRGISLDKVQNCFKTLTEALDSARSSIK